MSESLLSIRNLNVQFSAYGRSQQVLHDVSLDVPAHSQVALVGESGSGKTVTMKAIMGLLRDPPARILSGEIRYEGRDLLKLAPGERMKLNGTEMSMVFQDPCANGDVDRVLRSRLLLTTFRIRGCEMHGIEIGQSCDRRADIFRLVVQVVVSRAFDFEEVLRLRSRKVEQAPARLVLTGWPAASANDDLQRLGQQFGHKAECIETQ